MPSLAPRCNGIIDVIVLLLAGMAVFGFAAYLFFLYDQHKADRSQRP
jgi:uncharacterized membrane-anchored protein